MTDKEKLHQILSSLWKNDDSVGKTYYNQALQDVQIAIDSLQEETVSEELEKAAEEYVNSTLVGSPYIKKNAYKAGAQWKEQQMMAKAIDAEIYEVPDNDNSIYEYTHLELFVEPNILEKKGFKDNDKVKVIVIKED